MHYKLNLGEGKCLECGQSSYMSIKKVPSLNLNLGTSFSGCIFGSHLPFQVNAESVQ
jgi:hypothetical protein